MLSVVSDRLAVVYQTTHIAAAGVASDHPFMYWRIADTKSCNPLDSSQAGDQKQRI